jgi:hypothetical protein
MLKWCKSIQKVEKGVKSWDKIVQVDWWRREGKMDDSGKMWIQCGKKMKWKVTKVPAKKVQFLQKVQKTFNWSSRKNYESKESYNFLDFAKSKVTLQMSNCWWGQTPFVMKSNCRAFSSWGSCLHFQALSSTSIHFYISSRWTLKLVKGCWLLTSTSCICDHTSFMHQVT